MSAVLSVFVKRVKLIQEKVAGLAFPCSYSERVKKEQNLSVLMEEVGAEQSTNHTELRRPHTNVREPENRSVEVLEETTKDVRRSDRIGHMS